MPTGVKGDEGGSGRREQARTRLARRAVVDAARSLFLEHGFAAATVEAISDRSGVPQATVYRLFGSKVGILRSLLDTSIAGDDEPVAVADRPAVAAAFASADPAAMIDGIAGITTAINERTNDVYAVLVEAAASDADAGALLATLREQRAQGQGGLVRALAGAGALREGVTARDAADRVHALMSPEVYRLLVVERGWAPARYRRWLAETLRTQLTP